MLGRLIRNAQTEFPMKLRTVAKILGGFVALIIVALLAAPLFISSDMLKAQLIAQVKKATGRTLEIQGDTSVTLFPNIAVNVNDVTLSNPEGFTTPYFVQLKTLSTGAQLRPLLRGELIIDGITLDGATINMEELKSGAKNWEFTAEKIQDTAEKAAKAPEAQKQSESPIKRFALGDVTITNSAVNMIKPGANVMSLSGIDATLQGADANSPLKLEGNANYREEEISLAIDIANTKQFLNGESSPLIASVKLPGAALDFKGDARMGEAISAKGKLNANTSALPKVLAWATSQPAAEGLPEQVSVKGDLDYNANVIKLGDATLRADSLAASGVLGVNLQQKTPGISGTLDLGDVNLDTLLPPTKETKSSGGGAISSSTNKSAPSEGWSNKTVDLSGLKAVNADLNLKLNSLKSGKFELGKTATHVGINDGALALNIAQTALYSGTASGIINASPQGIGANLAISKVNIDALMSALSGDSRLEGLANVKLNVRATGTSQRAWVNSLNGNGAISVRDGALKGINIGQFLRDAKQGFLFKSEAESTDFSELGGTFTIAQGVLTNSDLAMKSPALRVTGSGSANLPARTLNYRLVPTLAQTSKGQGGKDAVGGLTVPLVITGAWSNPSVTPDLAGALQEGLKNPEAIKQNIESIKDTIGDFNSKDDLKRALLGEKKPATTTPTTTTAPATKPATTTGTTAPAPKPTKEEQIKQGIGGLLKGL